jgi:hypothetical protein
MDKAQQILTMAMAFMFGVGWMIPSTAGAAESEAEVVVRFDEPEEKDLVDWAVGRFEMAGLELPAVLIRFHEDKLACKGALGLYHPGDAPRVELCLDQKARAIAGKLTTLHELAHAWAETNTDTRARVDFLDDRGLDSWLSLDLPPHEWGAEHAAEVISWALMDELVGIVRIYDAEPSRLADGYRILTGSEPLVPYR